MSILFAQGSFLLYYIHFVAVSAGMNQEPEEMIYSSKGWRGIFMVCFELMAK